MADDFDDIDFDAIDVDAIAKEHVSQQRCQQPQQQQQQQHGNAFSWEQAWPQSSTWVQQQQQRPSLHRQPAEHNSVRTSQAQPASGFSDQQQLQSNTSKVFTWQQQPSPQQQPESQQIQLQHNQQQAWPHLQQQQQQGRQQNQQNHQQPLQHCQQPTLKALNHQAQQRSWHQWQQQQQQPHQQSMMPGPGNLLHVPYQAYGDHQLAAACSLTSKQRAGSTATAATGGQSAGSARSNAQPGPKPRTAPGGPLANRASVRAVVHQDSVLVPYQKQPAVHQRKMAEKQQQGQQQQRRRDKRRQQADMHRFFGTIPSSNAHQVQGSALLPGKLHHGVSSKHLPGDNNIIEVINSSDDEQHQAAQEPATNAPQADRRQLQQQKHPQQHPQQCQQQVQVQQQQGGQAQQQQPPQQLQQQLQQRQAVLRVTDPAEVARLLALAHPGEGGDDLPSQSLSTCPAGAGRRGGASLRVSLEAAKTWIYPTNQDKELRKYQYDMSWAAIRHNTLVSLPTGLGKTLIAAVTMYNFYRWFPKGKVVFLAPTRPLVDQQMENVKAIMGVHKEDIVKLQMHSDKRRDEWSRRRMFFCTPQMFFNDLKTGVCPANLLALLVVDECHRATGETELVKAVKMLQERKARFRILGLSATPGNDHARIQAVIKNLMIRRVEFRTDEDPDVAQYCFERITETRMVPGTQEGRQLKQDMLNLMLELVMRLNRDAQANLVAPTMDNLWPTPYMVRQARDKYRTNGKCTKGLGRGPLGNLNGRLGGLNTLRPTWGSSGSGSAAAPGTAGFAFSIEAAWEALLILAIVWEAFETSGPACAWAVLHEAKQTAVAAATAGGCGTGSGRAGAGGSSLKVVSAALSQLQVQPRYPSMEQKLKAIVSMPHPKLEVLVKVLQDHFHQQQQRQQLKANIDPNGDDTEPDISRAIVFCSYRAVVEMVAKHLKQLEPHIICRPFIGQSDGSKKGNKGSGKRTKAAADAEPGDAGEEADAQTVCGLKGMKQAEQKVVVADFRAGVFNVLLATSIGEEGLDIPQVDLIICWDSSASPSRARQRSGRTGRSRDGRVVYLLTPGREEEAYHENLSKEQRVKEHLRRADTAFELCRIDVPMLPADIMPQPVLIQMQEQGEPKAPVKGRGKRKPVHQLGSAAATGEQDTAAARKKPAKHKQQQQQEQQLADQQGAAEADAEHAGLGYAALKRTRNARRDMWLVESEDGGVTAHASSAGVAATAAAIGASAASEEDDSCWSVPDDDAGFGSDMDFINIAKTEQRLAPAAAALTGQYVDTAQHKLGAVVAAVRQGQDDQHWQQQQQPQQPLKQHLQQQQQTGSHVHKPIRRLVSKKASVGRAQEPAPSPHCKIQLDDGDLESLQATLSGLGDVNHARLQQEHATVISDIEEQHEERMQLHQLGKENGQQLRQQPRWQQPCLKSQTAERLATTLTGCKAVQMPQVAEAAAATTAGSTDEAEASKPLFWFDNGTFCLRPHATAVLLPPDSWVTRQLLHSSSKQQQQQAQHHLQHDRNFAVAAEAAAMQAAVVAPAHKAPGHTDCVAATPCTPHSGTAGCNTPVVGAATATRLPASAAAVGVIDGGQSANPAALAALLDQLMQPLSAAELAVAAAAGTSSSICHPLLGLALLQQQQQQEQRDAAAAALEGLSVAADASNAAPAAEAAKAVTRVAGSKAAAAVTAGVGNGSAAHVVDVCLNQLLADLEGGESEIEHEQPLRKRPKRNSSIEIPISKQHHQQRASAETATAGGTEPNAMASSNNSDPASDSVDDVPLTARVHPITNMSAATECTAEQAEPKPVTERKAKAAACAGGPDKQPYQLLQQQQQQQQAQEQGCQHHQQQQQLSRSELQLAVQQQQQLKPGGKQSEQQQRQQQWQQHHVCSQSDLPLAARAARLAALTSFPAGGCTAGCTAAGGGGAAVPAFVDVATVMDGGSRGADCRITPCNADADLDVPLARRRVTLAVVDNAAAKEETGLQSEQQEGDVQVYATQADVPLAKRQPALAAMQQQQSVQAKQLSQAKVPVAVKQQQQLGQQQEEEQVSQSDVPLAQQHLQQLQPQQHKQQQSQSYVSLAPHNCQQQQNHQQVKRQSDMPLTKGWLQQDQQHLLQPYSASVQQLCSEQQQQQQHQHSQPDPMQSDLSKTLSSPKEPQLEQVAARQQSQKHGQQQQQQLQLPIQHQQSQPALQRPLSRQQLRPVCAQPGIASPWNPQAQQQQMEKHSQQAPALLLQAQSMQHQRQQQQQQQGYAQQVQPPQQHNQQQRQDSVQKSGQWQQQQQTHAHQRQQQPQSMQASPTEDWPAEDAQPFWQPISEAVLRQQQHAVQHPDQHKQQNQQQQQTMQASLQEDCPAEDHQPSWQPIPRPVQRQQQPRHRAMAGVGKNKWKALMRRTAHVSSWGDVNTQPSTQHSPTTAAATTSKAGAAAAVAAAAAPVLTAAPAAASAVAKTGGAIVPTPPHAACSVEYDLKLAAAGDSRGTGFDFRSLAAAKAGSTEQQCAGLGGRCSQSHPCCFAFTTLKPDKASSQTPDFKFKTDSRVAADQSQGHGQADGSSQQGTCVQQQTPAEEAAQAPRQGPPPPTQQQQIASEPFNTVPLNRQLDFGVCLGEAVYADDMQQVPGLTDKAIYCGSWAHDKKPVMTAQPPPAAAIDAAAGDDSGGGIGSGSAAAPQVASGGQPITAALMSPPPPTRPHRQQQRQQGAMTTPHALAVAAAAAGGGGPTGKDALMSPPHPRNMLPVKCHQQQQQKGQWDCMDGLPLDTDANAVANAGTAADAAAASGGAAASDAGDIAVIGRRRHRSRHRAGRVLLSQSSADAGPVADANGVGCCDVLEDNDWCLQASLQNVIPEVQPQAQQQQQQQLQGMQQQRTGQLGAAGVRVVGTRQQRRKACVFVEDAAEDDGGSCDDCEEAGEDDADDLSGFITHGTEHTTASGMTERSSPGLGIYHRSLLTQTPEHGGHINMWQLVNGRHRAPPPQRGSKQQQQRGGQHKAAVGRKKNSKTAAATGGTLGQNHLLDSPPESADGLGFRAAYEPAGLTLADTPSSYRILADQDEYEDDCEESDEDDSNSDGDNMGNSHNDNSYDVECVSSSGCSPGKHKQVKGRWQQGRDRAPRNGSSRHQQQQNYTVGLQKSGRWHRQQAGQRGWGRHKSPVPSAMSSEVEDASEDWQKAKHHKLHRAKQKQQYLQQVNLKQGGKGAVGGAAKVCKGPFHTATAGRQQQAVGSLQQMQRRKGHARQRVDSDSDSSVDPVAVVQRKRPAGSVKAEIAATAATAAVAGRNVLHIPAQQDSCSEHNYCSDGSHDDMCAMCREEGELLMCDGCPLSFHLECVGLPSIPKGDWFCKVCKDGKL